MSGHYKWRNLVEHMYKDPLHKANIEKEMAIEEAEIYRTLLFEARKSLVSYAHDREASGELARETVKRIDEYLKVDDEDKEEYEKVSHHN